VLPAFQVHVPESASSLGNLRPIKGLGCLLQKRSSTSPLLGQFGLVSASCKAALDRDVLSFS
jgi:hypothetical protein